MMLSDVVMPGKDGLALLEDLRALGLTLLLIVDNVLKLRRLEGR